MGARDDNDDIAEAAAAVRAARRSRGWSAQQFADKICEIAAEQGDPLTLTQQAVSLFETGGVKSLPRWLRYAHLALVSAGVESRVQFDDDAHLLEAAAKIRDQTVEVAEIDLAYGMGGTFLESEDEAVVTTSMLFPRDWLRNFTRSPAEHLFFARGAGDSMMPTIHDSDIVLIDRSQESPKMADQIWAFAFGGVGMIKRLRPRPDGSIAIFSDNPAVPDDRAVDGELFIIGRVVAIQKKV